MDRKVLLLLGLLVVAAAGAFVYLDPLDLDLLGLKQNSIVATPARQHVASKAVVAPVPAKATVAAKSAVAQTPSATPTPSLAPATTPPVAAAKPVVAPAQAKEPAAPPAIAEAPVLPPEMKPATVKIKNKPPRPKNLDLRYCLELKTDAAIAKCAGE